MKINEFGAIIGTPPLKKQGAVSPGGNFAELLSEASETETAPPVFDVAATSALGNMLALQEISEEDIKRKKLEQQGHNMLDALEDLRQKLLIGNLPPSVLQNIGRQMSIQKQFVSDPRLMEIIDDIELRTAVELAKLEMALKDKPIIPPEPL